MNTQSPEKRKIHLISLDLITNKDLPDYCEICGSKSYPFHPIMKGPFLQYERRKNELYFDLKRKYYRCRRCDYEFDVEDFQVIVEKLARNLPPKKARKFTMSFMRNYQENSEKTKKDLLRLLNQTSNTIEEDVD
jgi:hypothetical protein